jgi:FG-GAP-like repeat
MRGAKSARGTTCRRCVVGLGAVVGVVALAGCHLGVKPVTYELVDADDGNGLIGPTGVATGDIDGDGDLDAVATGSRGYAVLANDGTGAYTVDVPHVFIDMSAPSLADIDADDDLDLVSHVRGLSPSQARVPLVIRNDGTGTFDSIEVVQPDPPPGGLTALVTADAEGDGDVDLLAALRVGNERHVATYLNDGTGAFGPPASYPLGFTSDTATPTHLVAGDLDGDGDTDVLATDTGDVTTPDGDVVEATVAMVGLNDGTGAFAAAGDPTEAGPNGAVWALTPTLADLDGDGDLDLAVGGPGSVTTLLGDGSGGFAAPRSHGVPETRAIDYLTSADIDEDGSIDLVGFSDVFDASSGFVAYGDGAGGIDEVHGVGTGTGLGSDGTLARDVEVTDLEGDGDPDILFLAGSLGVVENNTKGRRPVH